MSANVMTREQKLYAMRMVDLVEVAEKLGVKIDKKGKKSTAVLKILKAEENVAGDGTPLAEVGKEIAQQAKEKAEKQKKATKITNKILNESEKKETKKVPKREKKADSDEKKKFVVDLLKYLKSKKFDVKTWDKIPNMYAVKSGKNTLCEIYVGKYNYRVNFKANGVESNYDYTIINNYYLPVSIKGVEYSSDLYKEVLEASVN